MVFDWLLKGSIQLVAVVTNDKAFSIQAIRDIPKGEEITIDYGSDYWTQSNPCCCSKHDPGASSSKRKVDWEVAETTPTGGSSNGEAKAKKTRRGGKKMVKPAEILKWQAENGVLG